MSICCIISCGEKEKEQQVDKNIQQLSPKYIVGIGKVLPKGGLSELSVTQANKVTRIFKQIGDTVRVGEALFEMDAIEEDDKVASGKATLATAKANAAVSGYDIKFAELKLAELKKEYQLSKKLFRNRAETQQKVTQDSVAYHQQIVVVQQAKSNFEVQKARIQEQVAMLNIDKARLGKQTFKALQNGVLTRFDVVLGSVLSPNQTFGELAPLTELVIEGEIDEFYADKIQQGQEVSIMLVGQTQEVAKGVISFVGAGLQNKSIIYETVGEANDRRVRRFTVKINSPSTTLLINQKVECKIKL